MLSHNDETGKYVLPDYPQPTWAQTALLGVAFIGSVVGMLVMGYLGDLLGCERALVISNALIVFGALASAALSWGEPSMVWATIALCRFVLGVGVGGLYPLSAAKAAQGVSDDDPSAAVQKAGAAFFWQGPGSLAPYVLAFFLLQLPHSNGITSLQFRILLGAGALPALVVLLAAIAQARAEAQCKAPDEDGDWKTRRKASSGTESCESVPSSGTETASTAAYSHHWWTLLGTGGSWFFFDVAFYGTVIFAPRILKEIFGDRQSLTHVALLASMMACIGTLATAFGLVILPRVGAKALNTCGFIISAVLFMGFAVIHWWWSDYHALLFIQLCLIYLSLYSGPNVAAFVLPVMAFPSDVRSTFHGMSAGLGKLGAMGGTLLFPIVDRNLGVEAVMHARHVLHPRCNFKPHLRRE